jgi:MSHA biogenesis protein MshJ
MKASLQKIRNWFESLSKREQWLTGITAVVAVLVLWHTFLYSSWNMQNTEYETQIGSLKQRIDSLNTGIRALKISLQQDPDKETRDRIAALGRQIEEQGQLLRASSSDLISPREMAHVLEDVLKENRDLSLLRIQSGKSIPVYEEGTEPEPENKKSAAKSADEDSEESLGPLAYMHPLTIEFQGSFDQTLAYLQAVEGLQWRLFWKGIQLQTDEYPRANIRLQVYTLSLEDGWIGG